MVWMIRGVNVGLHEKATKRSKISLTSIIYELLKCVIGDYVYDSRDKSIRSDIYIRKEACRVKCWAWHVRSEDSSSAHELWCSCGTAQRVTTRYDLVHHNMQISRISCTSRYPSSSTNAGVTLQLCCYPWLLTQSKLFWNLSRS